MEPVFPDVGSSVVEDTVGFPVFEFFAETGSAFFGGDVGGEGYDVWDGFDWDEIDADDY